MPGSTLVHKIVPEAEEETKDDAAYSKMESVELHPNTQTESSPPDGAGGPPAQSMTDTTFTPPTFDTTEQCVICFGRSLLCVLCPICCPCAVETIYDYERGVMLRVGKQLHEGTLSGGLHIVIPCVDTLLKIDTRERLLDIPKQCVVTREGLSLRVDAVVYYKVFDATRALLGIENVKKSILMLAQTKLREILGTHTFDAIQMERQKLATNLKEVIDSATDPWGIDVTRVEITDITLPAEMERAMGSEAEAQRNAKAKVIEAEGEKLAAVTLKEAAEIMAEAPNTMQLRFLQTLTQISAEKNSTILIPFPSDLLSMVSGATRLPIPEEGKEE